MRYRKTNHSKPFVYPSGQAEGAADAPGFYVIPGQPELQFAFYKSLSGELVLSYNKGSGHFYISNNIPHDPLPQSTASPENYGSSAFMVYRSVDNVLIKLSYVNDVWQAEEFSAS